MRKAVIAIFAGAVLATGMSIAFAQQSSTNTKINDGINGAPNYGPMAPAGAGTASKISDGINGAPNYAATSPTAPAAAKSKTAASSKPVGTRQHAHHHAVRRHHS
jgi:hypothetical protein